MQVNLRDVIHFYLGCRAWDTKADEGDEIFTLIAIDVNGLLCDEHGNVDIKVEEVKPILRPLPSITDGEVDELWRVLKMNPDYENPAYPSMTKRKYVNDMFIGKFEKPFSFFTKMANWLRKNGFDCDRLIESGQALDATKINQHVKP